MSKQKASNFPLIPVDCNEFSIPQWLNKVCLHLSTMPWAIPTNDENPNRVSCILDADKFLEEVLQSKEYTGRSLHLSRCLVGLLKAAKDLNGAIKALEPTILQHDGIASLTAIGAYLVPPTPLDIIRALLALGLCVQRNAESADAFNARLNNIWLRIKQLGYNTIEDLQLALLQRGIFKGAYCDHKLLSYTLDKIAGRDASLQDWNDRPSIVKFIKQQFMDRSAMKEGRMVNVASSARLRQTGNPQLKSTSLTIDWDLYLCRDCTDDDVKELFQHTDCPISCLP